MRSVQNFGNLSILWNFQPSSHAKLERQWEVQMSEPQVKSRARAVEHWNTVDRLNMEKKNKVKEFRSISLKRPSWMLAKRKGKIKAYFVRMNRGWKIWFGITRQSNIGSFLWCIEVQHSFHEELCTLWTCNELCFLLCYFWSSDLNQNPVSW